MNRPRVLILTLAVPLVLTGLAGCKSSVDEKPKAKVEDAEPAKKVEDGGANADGSALALDLASSTIGFVGAKQVGEHAGGFSKFSGSATLEGGEVTGVEIVVDMASVTTDGPEKLTNHLKGTDFFEVETYPESKFTMVSITKKAGEGGATHEVVGNLELKGQVKKVTFPATLEVGDGAVHGKADFSIDRKLWGIVYAGQADNLIKDDVALSLDLHFK